MYRLISTLLTKILKNISYTRLMNQALNERYSFKNCPRITRKRGSTCDRHLPRTTLSEDQKQVVKVAQQARNIWLHGKAGCGKSYLTRFIIDLLDFRKKKVMSAGSTVIAASNINGHTLHHVMGDIGYGRFSEDEEVLERLKNADVLVIDEISMVGVSLFEKADLRLKKVRECDEPFGGLQLIVCGDFSQLPLVEDKFCYTTEIWRQYKEAKRFVAFTR